MHVDVIQDSHLQLDSLNLDFRTKACIYLKTYTWTIFTQMHTHSFSVFAGSAVMFSPTSFTSFLKKIFVNAYTVPPSSSNFIRVLDRIGKIATLFLIKNG